MSHQNIEKRLIEEYKAVFREEGCPDWAVRNKKNHRCVCPSIPFVGKQYLAQKKKIILYGSAENLTYYEKNDNDNSLLESDDAWNRRRISFNKYRDGFFPFIHVEPVNNGGLLVAVAFLSEQKSWMLPPSDPFQFIECISADNIGKFSIESGGRNIDYISSREKMSKSYRYIEVDLSVLNPDIIVLPKRAYENKEIKKIIHSICGSPTVVPAYQLTATVVNCHIANKIKCVNDLVRRIPPYLQKWIDNVHIKGLKQDGILFYLSHCLQNVE